MPGSGLSARRRGGTGAAGSLLRRDPAAHVSLDNPYAVARLLARLREAGAQEQAAALAKRAAAHVSLDDPGAVAWLLGSLRGARRGLGRYVRLGEQTSARVTAEADPATRRRTR